MQDDSALIPFIHWTYLPRYRRPRSDIFSLNSWVFNMVDNRWIVLGSALDLWRH